MVGFLVSNVGFNLENFYRVVEWTGQGKFCLDFFGYASPPSRCKSFLSGRFLGCPMFHLLKTEKYLLALRLIQCTAEAIIVVQDSDDAPKLI